MAARLSRAGADVSVVARGDHGRAMRTSGVTLLTETDTIHADIVCVEDPVELPPQDVVIVTMKWPGVSKIGDALARMTTSASRVVFAMNGIPWWFADGLGIDFSDAVLDSLDPGAQLSRALSLDQTVGGVIYSSNEVIEPGVIRNTSPRNRIILGKPDGAEDPVVNELVELYRRSGYDAIQTDAIRQQLWIKMLIVVGSSPVCALTGCDLMQLTNDDESRKLMTVVMREGQTIGRRLGFELPDDIDERLAYYLDKPVRASMLQDFELGRPPELENGILAFHAIASALGVEAPVTDTIATLVRMRRIGGAGPAASRQSSLDR